MAQRGGEDFAAPIWGHTKETDFLSAAAPLTFLPTETQGVAMGVVKFLTAMGLFIGQSNAFFELLNQLAADADAAQRGGQ